MNQSVIGVNIVTRRKSLSMTQEELAESSELSVNYISRIERGSSLHISAESLYKIAKALNIPMESLMEKPQSSNVPPGPKQNQLINYLAKLKLTKSEKLCTLIMDLINNYHE